MTSALTPPEPPAPREPAKAGPRAAPLALWRIAERKCIAARAARRWRGAATNRFCSAWPLAERYEALLRVFNDPTPYSRRLARRLRADQSCADLVMRASKGASELAGAENRMRLADACVDAFHAGISRAAQDTS